MWLNKIKHISEIAYILAYHFLVRIGRDEASLNGRLGKGSSSERLAWTGMGDQESRSEMGVRKASPTFRRKTAR